MNKKRKNDRIDKCKLKKNIYYLKKKISLPIIKRIFIILYTRNHD